MLNKEKKVFEKFEEETGDFVWRIGFLCSQLSANQIETPSACALTKETELERFVFLGSACQIKSMKIKIGARK